MKSVRVGSGSASWPDMIDPALVVAERGDIQYQGFDHLAELTMAILERMKARNPQRGYVPDVIPLMKRLLPVWKNKHFKMVSNGGGANPEACANEILKVAKDLGLTGMKIGVITGDDIPLKKIDEMRAQGLKFKSLDTGEEDIDSVRAKLEAAYVYIGADKVIEAFNQGADLVIGGRLADNTLFVAPFMHGLGWKFEDDYVDRIGAGVAAAHLLECSAWSTGACSTQWDHEPDQWNPGFPIAEMYENGDVIMCKAPGTGGLINEWTQKEHLVYELHDRTNYLTPDGIADLTALRLEDLGDNRVKLSRLGAKSRGKPRPKTLKLCFAYADGFAVDVTTVVSAPRALEQAQRIEKYLNKRLEITGLKPREKLVSFLGVNALHGPTAPVGKYEPNEIGVRMAFKCNTEEEARACQLEATLTWMAAGVGAAFTTPNTRPLFALYPTLIPRELVPLNLEIKEVK